MKNGTYFTKSLTEKLFYFFIFCLIGKIIFSGLSYYISIWAFQIDLTQIDSINNITIRSYKIAALLDQIGTFLIPSIIFCWFFNKKYYQLLKFHKLKLSTIIALPLILIIMVISSSFLLKFNHNIDFSFLGDKTMTLIKTNQEKMDEIHQSFIGTTNKSLLFNFFLMALVPAVCEEIAFRGILQNLFIKWTNNIHLGILTTSIIFAILHFQFYNIIPILIIGILLGYTLAITNNIWSTITLHFAFNSLSIISIYSKKREMDLENKITIENPYLNAIILLICIILLIIFWRKKNLLKQLKQNYFA